MAAPVTGQAPMPPQPMSNPSPAIVTVGANSGYNTSSGGAYLQQQANERKLSPPSRDPEKLRSLGARLASEYKNYEAYRKLAELRWARNLRQFLGEYDPEVERQMDPNRSRAYPRITRVKVVSMLSRLMNLLFPTSEKNWGIAASPVPNLAVNDLAQVIQQAAQKAQTDGVQLTSDMIEDAVCDFARTRAIALETEIADQLQEVGGNRNLDYVALCRRVLLSGIMYGAGVLKGPFVREQKVRSWVLNEAGQWAAQEMPAYRPQFEFVPIWDYYPDMAAKHLHQMDGQFQRRVMSKSQLRELADKPDFMGDAILKILARIPQGNFTERTFESELRVISGVHTNVNPRSGNKYEVLVWDGFVSRDALIACGLELPDTDENKPRADMMEGSIWMLDGEIIRGELSPWAELEPDERISMYHVFLFEEDDSSLLGNGLPNIIRDSQMSISASTRMLLDNASIVCGPNIEVNVDLMEPGQDLKSIQPYKVWYRNGTGVEAQYPVVKNVQIDSHIGDLKAIVELFMGFADTETFVNPATGGDMQKGPSEPFRTAAGASMIQGQAALPFKDVVRNFDTFTTSVIHALILFNKHFNEKPGVQGDFTPIARGSSSLIAKEVRGMAYDQLASTVQPEERPYINWYYLLKERLAVRDIDVSKCIVTEQEREQIDQAQQQRQQQQDQDTRELLTAEIRKLLADAVKSLTQADNNSAKAEVANYNAILGGLESGLAPTDVHAARAGAGVPPDITRRLDATASADAANARANRAGANKNQPATSAA